MNLINTIRSMGKPLTEEVETIEEGMMGSIEHRGKGFNVYYVQQKRKYVAVGTGKNKKEIAQRFFDKLDDAKEHAEMELGGINEMNRPHIINKSKETEVVDSKGNVLVINKTQLGKYKSKGWKLYNEAEEHAEMELDGINEEQQYNKSAAEKYFKKEHGKDAGTALWTTANGKKWWIDSATGEMVVAKEKAKPAGTKEYSGDSKNPIKEAKELPRQFKDKNKEMEIVDKKGKVIVIDKSKWNEYKNKGWIQAEEFIKEAVHLEEGNKTAYLWMAINTAMMEAGLSNKMILNVLKNLKGKEMSKKELGEAKQQDNAYGLSNSLIQAVKEIVAPQTDKSDDGEGMDKVDKKAVKKKFDDRKDKDLDNDGDSDDSDEYLHKKRQAISKDIDKEDGKGAKAPVDDKDDKAKGKGVTPEDEKKAKAKVAANANKKSAEERAKEKEYTKKKSNKQEPVDTKPTVTEEVQVFIEKMEAKAENFEKYGDRADSVFFATATKLAEKAGIVVEAEMFFRKKDGSSETLDDYSKKEFKKGRKSGKRLKNYLDKQRAAKNAKNPRYRSEEAS